LLEALIILAVIAGLILLDLLLRPLRSTPLNNPLFQAAFRQAGVTKLHLAAMQSDDKAIRKLLEQGADINSVDTNGSTCLHMACAFGSAKCIEILLDHGAGIETRDNRGCTPLNVAVIAGRPEIVEFLLNRGASLDTTDNSGNTLLQTVVRWKADISSNKVMKWGSHAHLKMLDECAEVLRKHGAK
jgi:ankyrin repeat protein